MHEIILHHYEMSPYAEKIRLALGAKGLAWRSVLIPVVMPKPDLIALTGGYRKTPVLQIGADVYCDTRVIARALERLQPAPPLFAAGGAAALERGLSAWTEANFMTVATILVGEGGAFTPEFLADRAKLMPGGVSVELARAVGPGMRDQLRARLDVLEAHLRDGRPFLLGERVGIADLSAYHPLWFLRRSLRARAALDPLPHVCAWMARVEAIGHGARAELDPAAAIEVARRATPATAPCLDAGDPSGRRPGDRVQVLPDDYGRDPVAGDLVASDAHEIAVRRTDPRSGEVVVHFPREGFLTLEAA